jgi:hypothetical protein
MPSEPTYLVLDDSAIHPVGLSARPTLQSVDRATLFRDLLDFQ